MNIGVRDMILSGITLLVLASVIAVVYRLLPILLWKRDPTDAWSHVYLARLIEDEGQVPTYIRGVFPRTECSYPWGLAWLFKLCRPSDPILFGSVLNLLVNCLEIAFVSILAVHLAKRAGIGQEPWLLVASVVGVYAVLPQIINAWSGMHGLTARPVGMLLAHAAILTTAVGVVGGVGPGDAAWLGVQIALLPLALLLSKFALQAMLLGDIALSLYFGSGYPVLAFALGLGLAVSFSPHLVMRILKGHIGHSIFYARFLQYSHVIVARQMLSLVRWALMAVQQRRFRAEDIYRVPILRAVIMNPWCVLIPLAWAEPSGGAAPATKAMLFAATLAFAIIPVLTFRHLRFLGEPDRYMAFIGTGPLAIVVGMLVAEGVLGWPAYAVLFSAGLAVSTYFLLVRSRFGVTKDVEAERGVAECLRTASRGGDGDAGRVVLVPTNLTQKFLPLTDRTFCGLYLNAPLAIERQRQLMQLYDRYYPYPVADPQVLREVFGVSHVAVSLAHTTRDYMTRQGVDPAQLPYEETFGMFRCVYENERYRVYDLGQTESGEGHAVSAEATSLSPRAGDAGGRGRAPAH